MKALVENAGGTLDDIGAVKITMKDRANRDMMNKSWVKSFPEAESRPARHVDENPGLGGGMQIQLEITAVIG
jgi:enamine deaminase RidA (YjgF/YER057c/UK114 family)